MSKISGKPIGNVHNGFHSTSIIALQLEKQDVQKKNMQLVEMYNEKKAKAAQNEQLYNKLKARVMLGRVQTAATATADQMSAMAGRDHGGGINSGGHGTTSHPFPIQPLQRHQERFPVDQNGVEQLHTHQRSGSGSNNSAADDAMAMPPPGRPGPGFSNGKHLASY